MKKYLIDTHVLIWFFEGDEQLAVKTRTFLIEEKEKIQVNMISLWEISIKINIGKLKLNQNTSEILKKSNEYWTLRNGFTEKQLLAYEKLPLHHRDPFDRILIAQAQSENLTIITKDRNFSKYDIDILW